MLPNQIIRGGGGGKGGTTAARGAKEVPDTFRSEAFAKVVDLLGEGEIEGFADQYGNSLADAQILSVSVSGGVIQSAVIAPGSRGYKYGTALTVTDEGGSGHGASLVAVTNPTNGEITSIVVVNGGAGYSNNVKVTAPSIIGQAILLDQIPVQNNDLSYNFEDVTIVSRLGGQNQDVMPGFNTTQQVIFAEEQEFRKNDHLQVQITDPNIDYLIIGVGVPSLYKQDRKTGDINGTEVTYNVYITYTPVGNPAGPKTLLYQDTIRGKVASPYVRTREADIRFTKDPAIVEHAWTIEFERVTEDAPDLSYANKTVVSFITGVTYAPMTYPNSALIGIEVNARQFKNIPTRGYRTKLLKVLVPNNYFPKTRKYNRIAATGQAATDAQGNPVTQRWNGVFQSAQWTDNPAWCFYDLVTNTRYGLGDYVNIYGIDKWALYKIAQYCDELVDDGYGGKEPRFTCNVFLQVKEDAYKVLSDMASIFRGMLYWGGGTIVPVQDAPAPPVYHFTNANVKDGIFTYAGTSRKTRHTVALVRYNDPRDNYRPKAEYVEDLESILRFGIREIEFVAFGCASRGQARRLGKWALYSERLETESCVFTAGVEAAILRPGDNVLISDNDRSGVLFGGRLMRISDDRTVLYTDRPKKEFNSRLEDYAIRYLGDNYSISFEVVIFNPLGQLEPKEITSSDQIETLRQPQLSRYRVVTLQEGDDGNLVLKLQDQCPIDSDIEPGSVFGLSSSILVPQQFKIIGIEELQKFEFQVTAIEHHPEKYDYVEKDLAFEEDPISVLPDNFLYPKKPKNLRATFDQALAREKGIFQIDLQWDAPTTGYVASYDIDMRKGLGNYHYKTSTGATAVDIQVFLTDTYYFRVYAVGAAGARSEPAEVGIFVNTEGDELSVTEVVTGLELFGQGNLTTFRGRDALFDWRINSALNSYEIGSEPPLIGANAGGNSPDFECYEINIYSPRVVDALNNETPIRTITTKDSNYVFRFDENADTVSGPHREIIFEVRSRLTSNKHSEPVAIRVQNPHPTVPQGVTVISSPAGGLLFQFPGTGNLDFAGWRVWVSENMGFDPKTVRPVYEGTANPLTLILATGKTYYYRYAEYDLFSRWEEYANFSPAEITAAISVEGSITI